jgi:hypothetical protein
MLQVVSGKTEVTQMWNLLRVNPQNQAKYCEFVRDNHEHIEVYFPVYVRQSRPAGKRTPIPVKEPVYPGYIFACPSDDSDVVRLMRAPTRVGVVRFGGVIAEVPSCVIEELRLKELRGELMKEEKVENPYQPGRKVVVHTPVATIDAIVVRMLGDRRLLCETALGQASVYCHQVGLA